MMRAREWMLVGGAIAVFAGASLAETASAHVADRATTPLDLHAVDWSSVTLPAVCGGSKPIKLHRPSSALDRTEGTANVSPIPRRWAGYSFYGRHSVEVDTGGVVYGKLAEGREDDAGLRFDCNNGGGTADGALLIGWVIFDGDSGRPSVVGVVTPSIQPPRVLPTLLEITIAPGKLAAPEFYYGRDDSTCCPSGRAVTTWLYSNGRLKRGPTTITRRAATSPPSLSRCQFRH
jgi:hypothetical protein